MAVAIFLGLIVGCIIGIFFIPFSIPYEYANYLAVAIFACLDSVFGALTAQTKKDFNLKIFITGFFMNAVFAAFIVFIGDKLGADVYLAAIFVFIYRLFGNFAALRRYWIDDKRKQKRVIKLLNKPKEQSEK